MPRRTHRPSFGPAEQQELIERLRSARDCLARWAYAMRDHKKDAQAYKLLTEIDEMAFLLTGNRKLLLRMTFTDWRPEKVQRNASVTPPDPEPQDGSG